MLLIFKNYLINGLVVRMSIYNRFLIELIVSDLTGDLETLVMSKSRVHPFTVIAEDDCLLGNVVVANVSTDFAFVANLTLPVTYLV